MNPGIIFLFCGDFIHIPVLVTVILVSFFFFTIFLVNLQSIHLLGGGLIIVSSFHLLLDQQLFSGLAFNFLNLLLTTGNIIITTKPRLQSTGIEPFHKFTIITAQLFLIRRFVTGFITSWQLESHIIICKSQSATNNKNERKL